MPRFNADELVKEFKESGGGLKGILEAMEMYSGKHYSRIDGNLKRQFYVQYVLSQMTLLDNTESKKLQSNEDETKNISESRADRKRDRKAKGKKETRVGRESKKSKRKSSHENLFV